MKMNDYGLQVIALNMYMYHDKCFAHNLSNYE